MGISDSIFDGFNNILVGVLAKAGVTAEDQAAVLAILVCLFPFPALSLSLLRSLTLSHSLSLFLMVFLLVYVYRDH
jgi:hypothetical protein